MIKKLLLPLGFIVIATSSVQAQKVKKVNKTNNNDHKVEYYVLKENKDIEHGTYKISSDRTVLVSGNYDQGKKNGTWIYYSPYTKSGCDKMEEFYDNGILLRSTCSRQTSVEVKFYSSQGQLDSVVTSSALFRKTTIETDSNKEHVVVRYISDGKLYAEGVEKNQKKDGIWTYQSKGNARAHFDYSLGEIQSIQSYYPDGSKFAMHSYDSGSLNGLSYVLYNTGDTFYSGYYSNGNMLGQQTIYYRNGQIFSIANYKSKKLLSFQCFDSTGKQLSQLKQDGSGKLNVYRLKDSAGIQWIEPIYQCEYYRGFLEGPLTYENSDIVYSYYRGRLETIDGVKSQKNDLDTNMIHFPNDLILMPEYEEQAHYLSDDGFRQLLASNVNYPNAAREAEVMGIVLIQFKVSTLGEIYNLEIHSKPIGFGLEEESKRIIYLSSGSWTPHCNFGIPGSARFRIPINFQLY